MKTKIRNYVDELFFGKPAHNKMNDIKEELISNLNEKYDDLIAGGYNGDEAFYKVIAGIGDADELLGMPRKKIIPEPEPLPKKELRSFIISTLWLGTTILFFMVSFLLDNWETSWTIFLLGSIANSYILLKWTAAEINLPAPIDLRKQGSHEMRASETEAHERKLHKLRKKQMGLISSILWQGIVVIYFVFSMTFPFTFSFSWIIFLAGAIVQNYISLTYRTKKD